MQELKTVLFAKDPNHIGWYCQKNLPSSVARTYVVPMSNMVESIHYHQPACVVLYHKGAESVDPADLLLEMGRRLPSEKIPHFIVITEDTDRIDRMRWAKAGIHEILSNPCDCDYVRDRVWDICESADKGESEAPMLFSSYSEDFRHQLVKTMDPADLDTVVKDLARHMNMNQGDGYNNLRLFAVSVLGSGKRIDHFMELTQSVARENERSEKNFYKTLTNAVKRGWSCSDDALKSAFFGVPLHHLDKGKTPKALLERFVEVIREEFGLPDPSTPTETGAPIDEEAKVCTPTVRKSSARMLSIMPLLSGGGSQPLRKAENA